MSVPPFQPRVTPRLPSVAPFFKSSHFCGGGPCKAPHSEAPGLLGLRWAGTNLLAPAEGPTALLQSYHWGSVSTSYPILTLCVYLPWKVGRKTAECCVSVLCCPSPRYGSQFINWLLFSYLRSCGFTDEISKYPRSTLHPSPVMPFYHYHKISLFQPLSHRCSYLMTIDPSITL